jgi:hypothetical protein
MPAEGFALGVGSRVALMHRWRRGRWPWLLLLGAWSHGQTCQSTADMDATARTAVESAAKRYFEMSARGDTAGLKQNSITAVAASFAGIEAAVKENAR